MGDRSWKAELGERVPSDLGREIDAFETELRLRKDGRIEEKLFAEARLRHGVYGQRYDNGERHDGVAPQRLTFPSGELTKGPSTLWDAPGMQRIKLPMGRFSPEQMDVVADLAEECSDGIVHITTRQDVQLHFVHIDDTPDLMRRLAAVGITTKEACGNAVRNVTACPRSGVCAGEAFDVTPYADALVWFLMGHPDTQDFGRKFKPAFSGCKTEACGLTNMHDLGAIAKTRVVDGREERGFELYVGGGLGAVPQAARLVAEFLPVEELLPWAQAVARVFGRLGEKKNRARARIKFLVAKLGVDEFTRLVREERDKLPHDPRWTAFLADLHTTDDRPLEPGAPLEPGPRTPALERWLRTNVLAQRQPGYAIATVALPLGDLTSDQLRVLAGIVRRFTGDTARTTVEQNIVLRWVPEARLPELYAALSAAGLGDAGAGTIEDITACPGTDTCKLGISSSRGLATELRRRLTVLPEARAAAVDALRIKTSGCFNACGQHHIAELGFLGVSRNVNGRRVPHFQVVLGGQWRHNAGSFGLAIGAVPSKRIPDVVTRVTALYVAERAAGESFQQFIQRIGKARIRAVLEDLMAVPAHADAPDMYRDWGDPREYTIGDMGVGECAGEVVPFVEFGLAASEREVFEAQLMLDRGEAPEAARAAYLAMVQAARALTRHVFQDLRADDPEDVVREFRARLCETKLFYDPFAGDKFATFLFRAHAAANNGGSAAARADAARERVEEATLFVDAAHACYARLVEKRAAP